MYSCTLSLQYIKPLTNDHLLPSTGIHARTDRHEPGYQRRNGVTGSHRVPHGGRFSALLVVRDRVYFKLQTDYLPGFLQSDLMWACALSTGARKRQSPAHRVNRKLFDESLSASYRTNTFTMPIDSMSTSELWEPSAISRTRAGSIVGDTVARRRANTMEDSPTVNNAVRVARYGSYKDNKDWDMRTEISREMSGMNVNERVLQADEKIPLKNLLEEAALEGFPNTSSKQPPWKCELVAGGWKANICNAYLVHTKTPYILYVIRLEECVDSMAADGVLSAKGSRVWVVGRRYSEFRRLYKMIRQSNPTWESSLVLPGKHSLKDNTKNTFIIKRMAGLQHLLSSALAHPAACSVPALRMFLTPKQDLSLLKMALKIGDPVELSPHPLFESHTASNTPPMQSMGTPHPPPTDFSHRTSCSDLEPDQFDADRSDRDDRGEKFLSKLSLTSESYSMISSQSDLNRPLSPVSSGMRHTALVDRLGPLSTNTASNYNANTETQATTATTTTTATQTQRTRTASSPRPSSLAQTRTVSSTIDDHDVFGITLRSDSRSSCKAVESPKRHSKATKKLSDLSSPPPVLIPVPATPPPLERPQMTTGPLKGPQIGKYGPNTSGADAVYSPTYHDDDEDGFVVVGLGKDGDGTWTKKPKRKSVILEATAHTHRSDELFGAHNDMAGPVPDATNSGVLHNWAMGSIISLMRSAFRPAWRKPWIRQPLLFIESFWSPVVDTLGTRLIWLIVGSELEPARLCDTIDLISLKLFTGEPAPTLTEDEMAALRTDSKRLLQEAMPGVLKLVLGPATLKNGLSTTHQMLQHEPLNHHLIYILLDVILAYLFPDVFEPPDIMDYNNDI
ncbi:hypothetical protein SARC_08790 [Sphaeroforma arctica JP610]|uniref:PX domain-containing protein n=1 Tax=Sphaeroforma arctica JP610 TaxID=667725 RepID=A0A0L0FS38_9EUKA|nr:hypothetical protein SARC_08790 [Sphaeroforma arctica JP610]KNC78788.1 hypothetical protein SARC_08790 [Sphaeroforma arctica JP610]|eukprot:XP_014152690.1 hypothetical protein SARC_08790 [Sphaeroforma arctica JP610]